MLDRAFHSRLKIIAGFFVSAVPFFSNNLGQVVHTHAPLSPSSIIWYRSLGGDAMRLGRPPYRTSGATNISSDPTCGLTAYVSKQAASQVSHTATDGGPPTSANHCRTPSIRCARPMVWNSLPDDLRAQQDYESFRQGLKTWLFSRY